MIPKPRKKKKDKMTSAEFRVLYGSKTRKKSKYHNKSKVYTTTLYGTRTFDSIKEANYCEELDWLLEAGEIKHYWLQKKLDIRINGKHWRNYFVDFEVEDKHGSLSFREVKGMELEPWRMKWDACMLLKDDLWPEHEWVVIK